jgi:hypothetical protein
MKNDMKMSRRTKATIFDPCLHGGQSLCISRSGKEAHYSLEPSGHRVDTKSALEAIATGLLKPGCDGLFGTSDSQTWSAQ